MTSPSSLILVHDNEKGRFCWKILMHPCRLHPYEYFTKKIFVPICNHSVEFDGFYRAEIFGRPCKKDIYTWVCINFFQDHSRVLCCNAGKMTFSWFFKLTWVVEQNNNTLLVILCSSAHGLFEHQGTAMPDATPRPFRRLLGQNWPQSEHINSEVNL